ncbi:MAG TPA: methyltransferase domain-containing protein [Chloroflexia bacterium]|nr:methyltransferase domain-containing protein [Chloroflexia bacterium]
MKDYKAIWNNLSTTFADASFYVCCIDDEDEIRSNGARTAQFLREVLQIAPADKVFEIGCGVARIGRELAPYCGEWHGGDISGNMIAYARQRTADVPNIVLHELPDNSLRIFPEHTFDCVYSSIVFMHVDKLDMFTYICEAFRVLKPGGRVYFDTYNLLAPAAWQEFLKTWQAYPYGQRPGHMSQFSTPQEMQKFMEEAGFESVHIDHQNDQLVVAVGRKSDTPAQTMQSPVMTTLRAAAQAAQAGAQDHAAAAPGPAPTPAPVDSLGPLLADMERKNKYIAQLETEVGRKNRALADLEQRLRRRERELVAARAPRLPWARRKPRS